MEGVEDTHPNGIDGLRAGLRRSEKRLGLLEQEIAGAPGGTGLKTEVALLRNDIEQIGPALKSLQDCVEGAVRQFNAAQGTPTYFWVGMCFALGIAAIALLLFAFVFARTKGVL